MIKSVVVLFMYEDLLNGELVSIKKYCEKFNISTSTFYRYISAIREYLWESKLKEVVYDAKKHGYKIVY